VFFIDLIVGVEVHVTIGVIFHHNFIGNIHNISTVPSTFTWDDVEWTFTIDHTIIWAVLGSPFIFDVDDTFEDFTSINSSVVVEVTVFKENTVVILIDSIFWVDGIITVGFIVSNDFNRD